MGSFFCASRTVPKQDPAHPGLLVTTRSPLADAERVFSHAGFFVNVDMGRVAGDLELCLQGSHDQVTWYDLYVHDYTARQSSTSGTEYLTIPLGGYVDIHVDHGDVTDWMRAFRPSFDVDPGVRVKLHLGESDTTSSFQARVYNDGAYGYGYAYGAAYGYGYGYAYGYGTAVTVRLDWERWGVEAEAENDSCDVLCLTLEADTNALVARLDSYIPYIRLQATNRGPQDVVLTAQLIRH